MVQASFEGEGNKALSNGHASSLGTFGNIFMNGSEVFKFAVRAVPKVTYLWSIQDHMHLGGLLLAACDPPVELWPLFSTMLAS